MESFTQTLDVVVWGAVWDLMDPESWICASQRRGNTELPQSRSNLETGAHLWDSAMSQDVLQRKRRWKLLRSFSRVNVLSLGWSKETKSTLTYITRTWCLFRLLQKDLETFLLHSSCRLRKGEQNRKPGIWWLGFKDCHRLASQLWEDRMYCKTQKSY